MTLDLSADFSHYRNADPGRTHFAAHSHHFWLDAVEAAQTAVFTDAARLADRKWELIFGEIIRALQRETAGILGLPDPNTLAYAPNTHEFVRRLLSLFPVGRPIRILTSDSEFHSFTRQTARLAEDELVMLTRVPAEPFGSFVDRFAVAARDGHDIAFVSHVFFNSGAVAGAIDDLVAAAQDHCEIIAIDGYHGFMALPLDLSRVAKRAFFLAGGYKYAMAGEGACFLHCPPGYGMRPRDTGWFASFGALQDKQTGVPYATGGGRFLGATFDPSGLYRQRAVFDWLRARGVTVAAIHAHVVALQAEFLAALARTGVGGLPLDALMTPVGDGVERGHFLTFRFPEAARIYETLMRANIVTDRRDDRLRFGFGCYHTRDDISDGVARIAAALA